MLESSLLLILVFYHFNLCWLGIFLSSIFLNTNLDYFLNALHQLIIFLLFVFWSIDLRDVLTFVSDSSMLGFCLFFIFMNWIEFFCFLLFNEALICYLETFALMQNFLHNVLEVLRGERELLLKIDLIDAPFFVVN